MTASIYPDGEDATCRSRRVLPYLPQEVFDAFARPEVLARWWGPAGSTNTFEVFEFRPGGRWKFVMHGPNDTHHPNESVFIELRAPSAVGARIRHIAEPANEENLDRLLSVLHKEP